MREQKVEYMTYEDTLHYLFTSTPVFQHDGASAYKPGLDTSIALDNHLGNPHQSYKTIHVAGTNGKGSVCHLLAAVLQGSGYKVGLYTSPHLRDFRERIRVNGQKIPKEYIINFVEQHKAFFEPLHPSFFELTSTMAFDYFRAEKVDFAIIEAGLGGRLDSTNIITPVVSVVTNISKDHTQFLGDTLGDIAFEKAGIIKPGVPIVLGEASDEVVETVFRKRAIKQNAPLYIPKEEHVLNSDAHLSESGEWIYDSADYGMLFGKLIGLAQFMNSQTVLCVLRILAGMQVQIVRESVRAGFENVIELTGLQGRWQEVCFHPYTVLDTGHNPGAWKYLAYHIESESKERPHLFMIIGLSNDKDVKEILREMPKNAFYIFTQASVDRAMPAETLAAHARAVGLEGNVAKSVTHAILAVMMEANDNDMLFIGGSNFIVADALAFFEEDKS